MPPGATTIVIAPIGGLAPELLAPVAAAVRERFGLKTAVRTLLSDIAFAHDPGRGQHHATPVLEALARSAPADAFKVLGVTAVDLFIPILTHVFGEAQLGGRACLVSTHRLGPAAGGSDRRGRLVERLVKEALHELGHTFALRHCRDPRCTMHYCRSEADVDAKSGEFCRYCRVLIADALRREGVASRPISG
jgi:archaemetzincin